MIRAPAFGNQKTSTSPSPPHPPPTIPYTLRHHPPLHPSLQRGERGGDSLVEEVNRKSETGWECTRSAPCHKQVRPKISFIRKCTSHTVASVFRHLSPAPQYSGKGLGYPYSGTGQSGIPAFKKKLHKV